MNELRRSGDERLDAILAKLEMMDQQLHKIDKDHADFYGRMDERVFNQGEEIKKHADEISDMNEKLGKHGDWINNANGKIVGVGLISTVVGGFIDHLFFKK